MTEPVLWVIYMGLVELFGRAFAIWWIGAIGRVLWNRRQYNRSFEARRRLADKRGVL